MFKPGDDVIVQFDGEDCPGEVLEVRNGWIMARIRIDPVSDFGEITSRMSPECQVIVRDSDVRLSYCTRCGAPHAGDCLRDVEG